MRKEIVKLNPKLDNSVEFRSTNLSSNTRKRYQSIVKNYYKFIEMKDLKEGLESVYTWLNSIEVPATHKLSLSAFIWFSNKA